jgi:hypothetical protein
MPYYIYRVTTTDTGAKKSAQHVSEFENFKLAKTEVRRLRTDKPLENHQSYKIMFADDTAAAEKLLLKYREEPIAREWEK